MQAVYYGQVEIIPGVLCDGYVLTDGSAVMSERGTADLLDMDQAALNRMTITGIPKILKPFFHNYLLTMKKLHLQISKSLEKNKKGMMTTCHQKTLESLADKDESMMTTLVKVLAQNSPYKGRKISVYDSTIIESLIRAYVLAFAYRKLQKNQRHIGERCAILLATLVRTALQAAIQEACGLQPQIQKLAQKNYVDAIQVVRDFGLVCPLPGLATKAEISAFLKTPMGTLNYFLRNNEDEIQPVLLTPEQIHALGRKTSRLYGYNEEDVVKMVLGMDTEIGIDIKRRMLGEMGVFFKTQAKSEVLWRKELAKAFEDDGLYYNYPVGKYRVDFFIRAFNVCLECNGYSHRHYDQEKEKERERFILQNHALIRFYPKADLSLLFRSILHCQPGQLIHLDPVSETV